MKLPKIVIDNSTTILSGLAVTGVIATVALAVRATPDAMKKRAEAKSLKEIRNPANAEKPVNEIEEEELSLVETVQATWRTYLPTAISGAATIACVIGANQIGLRRNAALIGAYTLVDTAFTSYKDEVLKVIGAKKELEIRDNIAERDVAENPPVLKEIVITGGGDQLCRDGLTGRYFRSDIETIRRAENEINATVLRDMYASQNEFYRLIGLPDAGIGEILGWNTDVMLKLIFTSALSVEGVPCLAIEYELYPRVGYDKF